MVNEMDLQRLGIGGATLFWLEDLHIEVQGY